MARKKAAPRLAVLTADGLAQLVLDRISRPTVSSAADLDLARKVVIARGRGHHVDPLSQNLAETLTKRLLERLQEPEAPTNVLEVARKFLGAMGVVARDLDDAAARAAERDAHLEASLRERGISLSDLPFPLGPFEGRETQD